MKKSYLVLIPALVLNIIFSQSVEIKDDIGNSLITINDEGNAGSLTIPSTSPVSVTTNKLINFGGTLSWDGDPIATGSSLWTPGGGNVYRVSGKVGIGTSTPTASLHVVGIDGVLSTGTINSGVIPVEGAGTRMMWYPKKAAFRAGIVSGTQWNDGFIGKYSTAMGNNTKASGEMSIATGSTTTASGNISTAMGAVTTASGNISTAMGAWVSTNGKEGSFIIGDNSTAVVKKCGSNNEMVMRFAGGYYFYTNSATTSGARLLGGANSWSTLSDSTLKENYLNADGEYFLNSIAKLRLGSWNYKSQDEQEFRHYGPMAQEIFHYFGKDDYGIIGNDTTLATADMDGIMMIALQALEKRTAEQADLIALLTKRIEYLESN